MWSSLVRPDDPAARPWLKLAEGERAPAVLDSAEPTLVVWSSLWPDVSSCVIRYELRAVGLETMLRWSLQGPDEPRDEATVRRLRARINYLINGSLRLSYGQ